MLRALVRKSASAPGQVPQYEMKPKNDGWSPPRRRRDQLVAQVAEDLLEALGRVGRRRGESRGRGVSPAASRRTGTPGFRQGVDQQVDDGVAGTAHLLGVEAQAAGGVVVHRPA